MKHLANAGMFIFLHKEKNMKREIRYYKSNFKYLFGKKKNNSMNNIKVFNSNKKKENPFLSEYFI